MKYKKPTQPLDFRIIKDWYNQLSVRFEMIRFMKFRESAVLVPSYMTKDFRKWNTRMLKIHSTQHLGINMTSVKFMEQEKHLNFYYSLARYEKGIPNQTLNFRDRDNSQWTRNHHKHMISYDFLLDIDAGSFKDISWAYLSAKNIKYCFDKYDVPYELRFSGKGFHFIIAYQHFAKLGFNFIPHDTNSIYQFYSKLADAIYQEFTEMTDKSIYDSRRLCKVPYSLAIYEGECYVCVPFVSEDEFDEFGLEYYTPDKYQQGIRGRGTYIFNEFGDIDRLLEFLEVDV